MKKPPENYEPSRILVIQLRQIGDVLLTTPALRALRKRFPAARISFLADKVPARVLEENPNLDEIIRRGPEEGKLEPLRTINKVRKGKYDLVIDFLANPRTTVLSVLSGAEVTMSFAGSRRSRFYTLAVEAEGIFSARQKLSLLRVLGCDTDDLELEMPVPEGAREKMENWLQSQTGLKRPLVCLEPFSKWPVLEYPNRYHRELARMMIEKWDATVVLCWGPGREEEARRMVQNTPASLWLAPPTDLLEAAALYQKADLWVGNDGGARHVAAGQGVPTFAVFGPTGHEWTPAGETHQSVANDNIPCRPCNKRYCPEGHHDCMNGFQPEEVFNLLDRFFQSLQASQQETRGRAEN
ncbi:MAG: glycosyltransferase family 9 protein [bacterium]